MKIQIFKISLIVIFIAFFITSCEKDSTSLENSQTGRILFLVTSKGMPTIKKISSVQIDSLSLTSVRVVIDEIEYENSNEDTLDFELEEPFVQELSLTDTIHEVTNVSIPFGVYEEIEIEVDRLKQEDGEVYINNPELQNLSIRVEGYLDGNSANSFIFTSGIELEQEFEFATPIVLDETNPSGTVILVVDLSTWFVDGNNQLLDPRLPENRSLIEENIKNSFKVYEDDDDDD